ncbi:MAG: NTP transferase domain-containing protein, partial [Deltaproteobacteria bacterium]|nr:NTP transferase domain-containing protein [Deltaproteobacteria bacterium]
MLSFPLIILAAGASTRMGMPKGLIEVEGKPWIIKQLDDFAAVGGKDVVVVLGYDAEKYVECIERRGTACRAP